MKTIWTDDRIRAAARDHVGYGWTRNPSGNWTPEQVDIYNAEYQKAIEEKRRDA